ncbi:MAG TPA: pseudouridine synthase, partial [Ktedonobacteraceae bacterium]
KLCDAYNVLAAWFTYQPGGKLSAARTALYLSAKLSHETLRKLYCGEKRSTTVMRDSEQNKRGDESGVPQGERLARFLAHAGIASRRHAETLIATGRVRVNGELVTTQGARVDPNHDRVSVDGKPVHVPQRRVYILLHKPEGYLCTTRDPQGRPTVLDLLPPGLRKLHIYPVGRLDRDTSGLLLLTNDGDFALHLSHPRYEQEKHYEALVQGHPSPDALAALRQGVTIIEDDGHAYVTSPARVRVLRRTGTHTWLSIIIHEGHKRQVRRMCEVVGYPVLRLIRVALGSLTLEGMHSGQWRYLAHDEVTCLLQ